MFMKIQIYSGILICFFAQNYWSQEQETHENHNHGSSKESLIENKGQWPDGVLFQSKIDGGKVWVQQNKFIYHLQDFSSMHEAHANPLLTPLEDPIAKQEVIHLNFIGSQEVNEVLKSEKSAHYYNYLKGNDPSKWASKVHVYGHATLSDFYEGIDLHIQNRGNQFKYEFIVAPNAAIDQLKLEYVGQKDMTIGSNGDLEITAELGVVYEEKPFAFQIIDGNEIEIPCDFVITDGIVSFELGAYNPGFELVIDPVLVFATYNGANTDNFGMTATYGYDGSAYSGGTVYGNDYPMPDNGAYDINSNFTVPFGPMGITDVFVSKFDEDGAQMLWSTFLGGGNDNTGTETAHSMICDGANNLYLFGSTSSPDFPVSPGAYNTIHNGGDVGYNFGSTGVNHSAFGIDLYVSKLSADGTSLMGSTYVGGSGNDGVNYNAANFGAFSELTSNYGDNFRGEIMLDDANNVIVASCTHSIDFPVVNAIQNSNGGAQDGTVFKLSADFSQLLFSTYYGGTENDACYSVKVDESDNLIFAGGTKSSNLPGMGLGYQNTYGGGETDGFVVKTPPSGTSITNASYIGMGQYDQVFFVEIDRVNSIFLLGQSVGGTFPVNNAAFSNGASSNFIMKLDSNLTTNIASTRFGNGDPNIHISPTAFLVDNCGNIYVSAWGADLLQATPLTGMPITPDAFQSDPPNGFDFYLMVMFADFSDILYGSYLGGTVAREHVDGGTSRFDKNGIVYQSVCGGCGGNSDFPTTPGAWSASNNSTNCNNLIFKFDSGILPVADFTVDQTTGCNDFTVNFENISSDSDTYLWDFGDGALDSTTFNPVITYTEAGIYEVNLFVTDSVCQLTDTAQITVIVVDSVLLDVPNQMSVCDNVPFDLVANSLGTANQFIWSANADFTNPLNSPSDSTVTVSADGTYYIMADNGFCSAEDTVQVLFDASPEAQFSILDSVGCAPLSASFFNESIQTDYFLWDFGNGEVDSVNFDPEILYTAPGIYTVSLYIFDSLCPASDTTFATITILPNITVSGLDSVSLCEGNVVLSANSNGTASTYEWSSSPDFSDLINPSGDSSIVVSASGTYYIQLGNSECSLVDSVFVEFINPEIALIAEDSICLYDFSEVAVENLTPAIGFNYVWQPDSIITSDNQELIQVQPLTSQYVYVTATSPENCIVEDSIFINVTDIDSTLVIASSSEYAVPEGATVTLFGSPSGLPFYQWSPVDGLSAPTNQQTNAVINEDIIYTLSVSDGICTRDDTVEIKVYEIICEDPYVFVPNAFSPNGDNYNDVLYVRGLYIEKVIFRVFNRWGEMVFESNDVSVGWDGMFRNQLLQPDVYDFYLDVTCVGGLTSIVKGNVTLMR
tara:strand:- start:3705 stop:7760 length:4056 start_codon:yes stop_codon:yes gene_type:complete